MIHFMAFIVSSAVSAMWIWWMCAILNRFIVTAAIFAGLLTGSIAFLVVQYMVNPQALWAGVAGSAFGSLIGVLYADLEY